MPIEQGAIIAAIHNAYASNGSKLSPNYRQPDMCLIKCWKKLQLYLKQNNKKNISICCVEILNFITEQFLHSRKILSSDTQCKKHIELLIFLIFDGQKYQIKMADNFNAYEYHLIDIDHTGTNEFRLFASYGVLLRFGLTTDNLCNKLTTTKIYQGLINVFGEDYLTRLPELPSTLTHKKGCTLSGLSDNVQNQAISNDELIIACFLAIIIGDDVLFDDQFITISGCETNTENDKHLSLSQLRLIIKDAKSPIKIEVKYGMRTSSKSQSVPTATIGDIDINSYVFKIIVEHLQKCRKNILELYPNIDSLCEKYPQVQSSAQFLPSMFVPTSSMSVPSLSTVSPINASESRRQQSSPAKRRKISEVVSKLYKSKGSQEPKSTSSQPLLDQLLPGGPHTSVSPKQSLQLKT